MENFVFCVVRVNIFLDNLQKMFFETALLFKSFMTEVPIKQKPVHYLQSKSMDQFLYDRDLRHERFTQRRIYFFQSQFSVSVIWFHRLHFHHYLFLPFQQGNFLWQHCYITLDINKRTSLFIFIGKGCRFNFSFRLCALKFQIIAAKKTIEVFQQKLKFQKTEHKTETWIFVIFTCL